MIETDHYFRSAEEFWNLVQQEQHSLWRTCRALSMTREDAEDLMSDTILCGYKNRDSIRDTKALRKYLSTIALRLHKRKRWRSRIFESMRPKHMDLMSREPYSYVDADLLTRLLSTLPERIRQTVILYEISELSLAEICEIQGGSLSGVKSRLVRGRSILKEMLADDIRIYTEDLPPLQLRTTGVRPI